VLAGDERAFRCLYREHATALYRLALRFLAGDEASAEDAWARAVRGLSGFEGRAALRSWLSAIVVRCCLERIRWERRGGERLADDVPSPVVGASSEARVDLERAFEALPWGYRSVLVLHDIEGYTHEAIAGMLDISPGTSKSQLSRARASLRRSLGVDYVTE
jgi:RNA polymerase sigma factor (sigma-70 family)